MSHTEPPNVEFVLILFLTGIPLKYSFYISFFFACAHLLRLLCRSNDSISRELLKIDYLPTFAPPYNVHVHIFSKIICSDSDEKVKACTESIFWFHQRKVILSSPGNCISSVHVF